MQSPSVTESSPRFNSSTPLASPLIDKTETPVILPKLRDILKKAGDTELLAVTPGSSKPVLPPMSWVSSMPPSDMLPAQASITSSDVPSLDIDIANGVKKASEAENEKAGKNVLCGDVGTSKESLEQAVETNFDFNPTPSETEDASRCLSEQISSSADVTSSNASQLQRDATEQSYASINSSDFRASVSTRRKRPHMLHAPAAAKNDAFNSDSGSVSSCEENDNDSTCNECHGGGELVCCDGCVKSYHSGCLSPSKRPRFDADGDWYCPDCKSSGTELKGKNEASEMSRLRPSSSPAGVATTFTEGMQYASSVSHHAGYTTKVDYSMHSRNSPTAYTNGRFKVAASDRSQPLVAASNGSATPLLEARYFKRKKKVVEEGPNDANRINIGPRHQVPVFPSFYLDRDENDFFFSRTYEQAKLVFSPMFLEQFSHKRLLEGKTDCIIQNDDDLTSFVQKCASNWKTQQEGWHPFSPEFAYKLLHSADYNPDRALQLMNDPHFSFQRACDPPVRKYENKWKPKDRRGGGPMSPFPPPVTVRGYLSRRQHNTAYMLR